MNIKLCFPFPLGTSFGADPVYQRLSANKFPATPLPSFLYLSHLYPSSPSLFSPYLSPSIQPLSNRPVVEALSLGGRLFWRRSLDAAEQWGWSRLSICWVAHYPLIDTPRDWLITNYGNIDDQDRIPYANVISMLQINIIEEKSDLEDCFIITLKIISYLLNIHEFL